MLWRTTNPSTTYPTPPVALAEINHRAQATGPDKKPGMNLSRGNDSKETFERPVSADRRLWVMPGPECILNSLSIYPPILIYGGDGRN